jgi:organic radical activating enzyme
MKTFCPIPWIFQAPRSNGDLRICCQANNSKTAGILRKDDGTPYNAGTDDLQESRNAELMKVVRKNMLNGIWSDECLRCRSEEENNESSRRMYELSTWDYSFEDAQRDTNADGIIDTSETPLHYYDFRFGNKCNLACRMCGPTDSDFWYDDWIKLRGTNEFQDNGGDTVIIGKDNSYNWHSNESFWKQIESNIHNIQYIYFAGGEPLLIQRHYDFLERCVEEEYAKNIVLEYNTNLTTLPPRVLKLWEHFKKVKLGISIDGYGDVFEYQRYPAKWDKVYNNILKVDALPENIESWFAYTVSVYNVEHFSDFARWFKDHKFNKIEKIVHHMVSAPPQLNVKVLPVEYKKLVSEKLLDFLREMSDNKYDKELWETIESVLRFMNSRIENEAQYANYLCKFTNRMDEIRKQDINSVVPNLAPYIKAKINGN